MELLAAQQLVCIPLTCCLSLCGCSWFFLPRLSRCFRACGGGARDGGLGGGGRVRWMILSSSCRVSPFTFQFFLALSVRSIAGRPAILCALPAFVVGVDMGWGLRASETLCNQFPRANMRRQGKERRRTTEGARLPSTGRPRPADEHRRSDSSLSGYKCVGAGRGGVGRDVGGDGEACVRMRSVTHTGLRTSAGSSHQQRRHQRPKARCRCDALWTDGRAWGARFRVLGCWKWGVGSGVWEVGCGEWSVGSGRGCGIGVCRGAYVRGHACVA